MVDDITKDVFDVDLIAVIFEVKLVESNPNEWWINIGATHHVYYDKKMFSIFKSTETKEKVFMKNFDTFEIKGQEKMVLKMTYVKYLTMTKVLYVTEIYRNLMFGSLLNYLYVDGGAGGKAFTM